MPPSGTTRQIICSRSCMTCTSFNSGVMLGIHGFRPWPLIPLSSLLSASIFSWIRSWLSVMYFLIVQAWWVYTSKNLISKKNYAVNAVKGIQCIGLPPTQTLQSSLDTITWLDYSKSTPTGRMNIFTLKELSCHSADVVRWWSMILEMLLLKWDLAVPGMLCRKTGLG